MQQLKYLHIAESFVFIVLALMIFPTWNSSSDCINRQSNPRSRFQ